MMRAAKSIVFEFCMFHYALTVRLRHEYLLYLQLDMPVKFMGAT